MSTPLSEAAPRRRVVVVGASSGLGRSIGVGLGSRGDRVALLARRKDRLDGAVEEAGPDAVAVACDVTDAGSCRRGVDEAARSLGGIDALVYCAGVGRLENMADVDPASWADMFATNVTGAAVITAAALGHLVESRGVAAYLSSVSASLTPPWPGLGGYAVSKAALDKMVEAWRGEHPDVGFTRVVVGNCAGGPGESASGFPTRWDADLATQLMTGWVAQGLIGDTLVDVEELVDAVHRVVHGGADAAIDSITVVPREPRPTRALR